MRFSTDTLDSEPIHLLQSTTPGLPPEAYLGIIRNHHTYSAEIPIPHSLGETVSASHAPHNVHITIMDKIQTAKQGESDPKYISTVMAKVKTMKEGNISENIEIFTDEGERRAIEVVVTAKVIKTNQGNPVLRTGIHVLSHEHSEEEDKEWPGSRIDAED